MALCYDIILDNKLPGSLIHLVKDSVNFNLAAACMYSFSIIAQNSVYFSNTDVIALSEMGKYYRGYMQRI